MSSNRCRCGVRIGGILALALAIHGPALAARKEPSYVIAVPARSIRVVQLVQDVQRLRAATVVAYQGRAETPEPVLHMWDGYQWRRISIDDVRALPTPERVLLIGDAVMLPTALVDASSRCETVQRIETLDVVAVATALSKALSLSASQIEWLARRNQLSVTDRNEERRRYGRYGKPGAEGAKPPAAEPPRPNLTVMPPEPDLTPVAPPPDVRSRPNPLAIPPEPVMPLAEPVRKPKPTPPAPEDK